MIGVDIETYDPLLEEQGPGVYRKDGYIIGVGFYFSNTNKSEYFGIANYELTSEERIKNKEIIKNILLSNEDKVFANSLYDLDWLINGYNFIVNGKLYDIQIAEPILDEYKNSYSLDTLAKIYLNKTKYENEIALFASNNNIKNIKNNMHLLPMNITAKYCKEDAKLTYEIIQIQLTKIKNENLEYIHELECDLIPLLLQMRKQGVRVSKDKIIEGSKFIKNELIMKEKELYNKYGFFNVNSSKQVANILDKLDVTYSLTDKGNPSIDKDMLDAIDHPIAKNILDIRKAKTALNNFLLGSFVDYNINNRIHCQFYNLKKDDGGTCSGRLSSRHPNLQQIPSKDDTYALQCRSVFVPEEGCEFCSIDESQIEYRVIAHYAIGDKSDDIRERYVKDPYTDYHNLIMSWTGFERKIAKNLNFGAAYFMGAPSMSKKFHWTFEQAKSFLEKYFKEVPFILTTREEVVATAKRRGYIRTILGRKARINNVMRLKGKQFVMFNRLIQGSAADILKEAMRKAYKSGIFNILYPHLTIHDELVQSVPLTKEGKEAKYELKNIMENSVKLKVPLIAEISTGTSWGTLKKEDDK